MALDFGTIAHRGANIARSELDPTVQANLASVPGLRKRIDYFSGLMDNPLNENEIRDYFSNQSAANYMGGRAPDNANIFQNVLGLDTLKRNVRGQAANDLGNAAGFMQLNPLQTGDAVNGALQAETFNESVAAQDERDDKALGRGKYGMSDLGKAASLAMGVGGAFALPALAAAGPAMGAMGAAGGAGGAMGGARAGMGGFGGGGGGYMSPFQRGALTLSGFGAGSNLGGMLFR